MTRLFINVSVFFFTCISTVIHAQKYETFRVTVTGQGQPVFLFPGFACTDEVYEGLLPSLSGAFEVHRFTFAGFGDVPPVGRPWLSRIREDVADYARNHVSGKPVVIGHSMGGTLGLWLACGFPATFSRLILIDALPAMGAVMMPGYDSSTITYDSPYNRKLLDMNEKDFAAMVSGLASGMTSDEARAGQIADRMIAADRETYVYGYTDLLKLDLRQDLSEIDIPVTILAATVPYGKEMAARNYKAQYRHLRDYKIIFAEGSAHFIMYDRPDWFLHTIQKELNIDDE
ncbi:alpha/beta fold hydrolase [Sinomicrobium oceani]|uniref:alpha/beta fold hydrolase n=1 Tax=Sinomicrobium oceani TaxID=1150368 RepID=UPI00227A6972|nr:alpha/beta hydrolase [Sinomicrobium oceani]